MHGVSIEKVRDSNDEKEQYLIVRQKPVDREMVAGLTMAVVPHSLGLVVALAVSGTTMYLVYEYNKKKAFVNIQRGKGSWRLEYLDGGSDNPQKQQPVVKESGECAELIEGNHSGLEQVQWRQLQWLRKAVRRLPPTLPATLTKADLVSPDSGNESLDTEETLKDRLANREVDEAQDTGNDDHQQRSEHVTNFSIVVTSTRNVCPSEFHGRQETSDSNLAVLLSSSSNNCRIQERLLTDTCSEDDVTGEASLSSAASSPSFQKLNSLVGCRISPGSGKAAGKPKKVVRFCPSVAEPSSNNQAYRNRFNKAGTAQRAALQVQQRIQLPCSKAAVRSISYDRPRQTLTYSVHRYRGSSHY